MVFRSCGFMMNFYEGQKNTQSVPRFPVYKLAMG